MKSYWQCLLELPRFLEHGKWGARSGQHPLYYLALRTTRTPSLVLPDMKVAYYTAIVQGGSPVDAALGCAPSKSQVIVDEDDSDDLICVSESAGSSRRGQERAGTHATHATAMPPENVAEDPGDDLISTAEPTGCLQHVALTGIPGHTCFKMNTWSLAKPVIIGVWRSCVLCATRCITEINRARSTAMLERRKLSSDPWSQWLTWQWAANARRFTTARHHIAFGASPAQVEEYMRSKRWCWRVFSRFANTIPPSAAEPCCFVSCIKWVRCCSYQHALQHDSCMSVRMRRRLGIACHKYVCNMFATGINVINR